MTWEDRETSIAYRRNFSRWRITAITLVAFLVCAAGGAWSWWTRPLARAEESLRQGKPNEAMAIADRQLQAQPDLSAFLSVKARAYAALGQWSEAAIAFEQFPVAAPRDWAAWADVLMHLHRWQDARPILKQYVDANPNDGRVQQNLVMCRYELGEFAAGLLDAEHLSQISGFESQGQYYLGRIYWRLGDSYRALVHWNRVVAATPSAQGLPVEPAEFFLDLGDAHLVEGHPRQAIPYLTGSNSLNRSVRSQVLLGDAWSQCGNAMEATRAWEAALSEEPGQMSARVGLAETALEQNNAAGALAVLQPVAILPATTSHVAFVMQRAYTALGQREASQEWQHRTAVLCRAEKLDRALRGLTARSSQDYWKSVLTCYRFAFANQWKDAASLARQLARFEPSPFLVALTEAIEKEKNLPPLERFPVP